MFESSNSEFVPQQERELRAEFQSNPTQAAAFVAECTQSAPETPRQPCFPEAAWRPGLFDNYRQALRDKSEAAQAFHFGAVLGVCSAALERRLFFHYGLELYPNTNIVCIGPTGDKKTSAERLAVHEAERAGIRVIRGGGSGEGLAEDLQKGAALIFSEELSAILRPARWEGATLGPLLTQAFDCPERIEWVYRKNRITVERPTLNLLSATTPEWFWRDARDVDLAGGLGSRLLYLDGVPQGAVPLPGRVDVAFLSETLQDLRNLKETEVQLDQRAERLWIQFYGAWRRQDQEPLEAALTKRIPAYALKLAMTYAALEHTLPEIRADQLAAAILVVQYAAGAVRRLIDCRHAGTNPTKNLESKILSAVKNAKSGVTTKRYLHQSLSKYIPSAHAFNQAFDAIVKSEQVSTSNEKNGRTCVWADPD